MISIGALVASAGAVLAQGSSDLPYCADLKQLNNLAMSRGRFAPIIGQPHEGNFRDTTLPLTGWMNCAFYGATTYTCDSPTFETAQDAMEAQSRIAKDILACFAGTWAEAPEQTSTDFLVLHPKLGPASITLNLGRTDQGHIVRFILFLRRG
jgi:hypothetical protein